ncbi:MAG: hypothetical protein ACM3U1_02030 [Chloroflexota bacterium]
MKKAFSIILILLFFGDAAAPPVVFAVVKRSAEKQAKRAVEQGVPARELFRLSSGEPAYARINWIKPEKEFTLNGNFYDVVRVAREDGNRVYYSLQDRKEKELFRKYGKFIASAFSNKLAKNKLARLALKKLVGYKVYLPFALPINGFDRFPRFDRDEQTLELPGAPPAPPPRSY